MNKKHDQTPALFISKAGATKYGLKGISRSPVEVKSFEIREAKHRGELKGYHLIFYHPNPEVKPRVLTNHEVTLLDQSKIVA